MNDIIQGIEEYIEREVRNRLKPSYEDTATDLARNSGALNILYHLRHELFLLKEKLKEKT